jgi:hypothetical protein
METLCQNFRYPAFINWAIGVAKTFHSTAAATRERRIFLRIQLVLAMISKKNVKFFRKNRLHVNFNIKNSAEFAVLIFDL